MYIHVYIYIYIYMYIYIFTHKHIYICILMYIHTNICICVFMYVYLRVTPADVDGQIISRKLQHTPTHCNVPRHTHYTAAHGWGNTTTNEPGCACPIGFVIFHDMTCWACDSLFIELLRFRWLVVIFRNFPQKSPMISCSFAERDLQLEASYQSLTPRDLDDLLVVWANEPNRVIQGGKDAEDALSWRSFSAKEPLSIGLVCGKWTIKIRQPTGFRHSVIVCARSIHWRLYCIHFV